MTRMVIAVLAASLLGLPVATARAQSIMDQVLSAGEGKVRMSFSAREGVCGHGRGNVVISRGDDDWEPDCEPGPVRVVLDVRGRRIVNIESHVGGRWRASASGIDLGTVAPQDAADFLLDVAADPRHEDGEDAIFPATIAANVTVWPRLIEIARDRSLPSDTRRQAIFWTGQEASRGAGRGLEEIIAADHEEMEIRKHAIFALSQRDDDEAVPALIQLIRADPHPKLQQSALFWLAQTDDPRVLDLFEEILAGS